MAPTYLLTAASGHIGQRLVPLLLSHPSQPTLILPTTNAARLLSTIPANADKSRIHILEGSLQDPPFIEVALKKHSVTAVFLCITGDNELFTTFNLLDTVRRSPTTKHLVYLSAAGDMSLSAQASGSLTQNWCAHVAVKYIVEAKLMHGVAPREQPDGFSWTILGPTLFFDNDYVSQRGILDQGVFDTPLGAKGVSRVSEDDVALAAVTALVDDGAVWGGKKIMLGERKLYTAQSTAALWSRALGRDVQAVGCDEESMRSFEDRFSRLSEKPSPAWGRDIRLMWELWDGVGFGLSEEEYGVQVEFLGKEAEDYEGYVERTAKVWVGGS